MASDRQRRGRASNDPDLGAAGARDEDLDEDFGSNADPLGQSMPNVTEAHLAERGAAPSGKVRDQEEHEVSHAEHRRRGIFGRAADFLRASWTELRRVQWPDRRQVGQGTAVTIGFVLVAGAYLGALDAIWNPIIQKIL
jgi:preprotein translocase SecE subunit